MNILDVKAQTKSMIDDLKSICTNYGLGNASSEYKIITEVFLYKFLNDKFIYEAKKAVPRFSEMTAVEVEVAMSKMTEDDYELMLMDFGADTAKLKREHYISHLFNNKNTQEFHKLFDDTLIDIGNYNIDIFSVKTGGQSKIRLFASLSQFVIESEKKDGFCRAIIDKLANCSFEKVFSQKYDFFADVFEYLVKDYNKDFGKYAEYYTPHSIANIIARIMVPKGAKNVTVYDPAAGSGTLVLALAHQIGEENCMIYTQDISQKSNEFLRLNLILNNLVHSLPNVVHDDTLLNPRHLNDKKDGLMTFDYIVSNPPFNTDFSDTRDILTGEKYRKRFFAGVPNIPNKDKTSMAIYTCFIQHIINSLNEKGKGAVVVPSGFLTDTGKIQTLIRENIIKNRSLKAVIQMPTNIFANTNTSVSIIFIDKSIVNDTVMFVDASRMGQSIKVDDILKTVFTDEDKESIIDTIFSRDNRPEFSVEVGIEDIEGNDNLIKPGLYFEMQYPLLKNYAVSMKEEMQKMEQRKSGLKRVLRSAYAKNLIIKWFVDFDFPKKSGKKYKTEYGDFPVEFDLIPLQELISETLGGEWGKENPEGRYVEVIKCIRGTDIPNIAKSYYDDVPIRYVQKKHITEKRVKANDIIVEISGGSPIQSTGRTCFISNDILLDMEAPVLCTNFCRVIRLKEGNYAEFIYNYILLLYSRGYFFNLENNTTGIKNLIFKSFIHSIKVPIPKDFSLLDNFMKELNNFSENLQI